MTDASPPLSGLRVVETADELGEYAGLILAGLGAEVIKVEPPGGSPTRSIGPFYNDEPHPDRSLHFFNYNRGKRSVFVDLDSADGARTYADLIAGADIAVDSIGASHAIDLAAHPHLIVGRVSPFGETGPWKHYKGCDLVHLALGGQMMNCGYDPRPDRTYDLPPMAPQVWHSYHVAGEQLLIGLLGALYHRSRTGQGQLVTCAVHEALAKNTELDLMNWIMRRVPLWRQTCRHAAEAPSLAPGISHTKDGRWFALTLLGPRDRANLAPFLDRYGMAADLGAHAPESGSAARQIPGSGSASEPAAHAQEVFGRLIRKFTYDEAPWREAQEAGLICVPLRKPHDNARDEHWHKRATFADIDHPELNRSLTYVTAKWISNAPWVTGSRAPLVGEQISVAARPAPQLELRGAKASHPRRGTPMALDGIRIFDFTWFLASAGGTRFLAALGAESIKVEWHAHPDTRLGAMAPVGGRAARDAATEPLPGVSDSDMGGQFNNKNPGKRGISLNVRHPRGLEIAKQLVALSDIVAEGFSPGVMASWGLGYDVLRAIKPDIVYAQQSGMGSQGTYGRFRALGPIAQAMAGTSEMSGLPEPAMPAGWGYSYLDWIAAYSFATAILTALYNRDRTGEAQHVDASQCETGIFLTGAAVLDWSANNREWQRYGNRSPYKPAAPHGAYRCLGDDRWIAIGCFTDAEWHACAHALDRREWLTDARFATLADRIAHHDQLDRLVNAATVAHDAYALMHQLQAAGVPAGVCQTAQDRCENDPQLAALEWLTELDGTKIGRWPVAEVPFKLSATPAHVGGTVDRGAPCYGEDNEYVYGELLGMSSREIAALKDDGVI